MALLACGAFPIPCGAQPGRPPAPVVVAAVEQRDVASGKTFVGSVRPRFSAEIGSAVAGRVTEVFCEEGDAVNDGDPLVQILTETIEWELASAVAELRLREEELAELKNGTRKEELAQAKASLLAAEAQMTYEKRRRERLRELVRQQAAAREELDEAASAAKASEQTVRLRMAAFQLAQAGPRKEQIAQAKARVAMQEAVVKRLESQIRKHTLVSRFDGFVTAKLVEKGQWVNVGDAAVEVVALAEVDITVPVAEEHIHFIRQGIRVPVFVDSAPDEWLEGEIVAIVPQADAQARTFPVKVRVTNRNTEQGPALRAGMLATVNLPTSHKQPCLLVPKDAVVLGGATPMVFVVQAGEDGDATIGKVAPIGVQLGVAHEQWIEVRGRVQPGDRVVVKGNERLRPGQDVQVVPSIGGRDAAASAVSDPPHNFSR